MPVYTSNPQNVVSGGNGGDVVQPPESEAVLPESGRYVPAGGTTGQVLSKTSDTDYDTSWQDGGGGTVDSVNGQTGAVVLDTGDIASVVDSRYVTDAQLVVIGNTSGVNTGDQTNIPGNAATVTTNANLTGVVTSVGNATSIANGVITNAMLANAAVANLSGTNTGDQSDATLPFTDITTNNVTSTQHGFAPKSVGDATTFLNGAATPAYAAVKDSDLSITDITTNNATTSAHGFLPKLPNSVYLNLNGIGGYTSAKSDQQIMAAILGSNILYTSFGLTQFDITQAVALADGTVRYVPVYVPVTTTLTGVTVFQSVLGSYVPDNYNGVGLYSINLSSGDITLVASSTDDATLWSAGVASTFLSKAFSSQYVAAAGIYLIALLYNTSSQTTAPTFGAYPTALSAALFNTGFANTNVKLLGSNSGEATLAASVATASIAVQNTRHFAAVY